MLPNSLVLSVPQDTLQLAMGSMSPSDLLALRSTARLFQRVIDGPQSEYIWGHAFRNVKFEAPIDVPYSPLKIAALAFGGGECYTCGTHTLAFPDSFTLNIRFCALACQFASTLVTDRESCKNLPFAPPSRESSEVFTRPPPHLRRQVDDAWQQLCSRRYVEDHQPSSICLSPSTVPFEQANNLAVQMWMENGKLLYEAATEYREKKVETVHRNYEVLTRIAGSYAMTFSQLVSRSPTLARQVNAFSRDLKLIDTVWQSISKDVLAEVIERGSFDGRVIPCPFCAPVPRRRLFEEKGLNSHIAEFHREHVAEEVQVPKVYRCSLCPARKGKVFDRVGLRRHIKDTVARHS